MSLNQQHAVSTETSTSLRPRYLQVRAHSCELAEPLSAEDCTIQSMPEASPTKWHLAHTTWFFETFILLARKDIGTTYRTFDAHFGYLFNSYYNAVGTMHPRAERGLLSRPSLDQVLEYRRHVDGVMLETIESIENSKGLLADLHGLIELGLNHEQQHQELMLTDIKHALSCNPLYPAYIDGATTTADSEEVHQLPPMRWEKFQGGLQSIGHQGEDFAFDNEAPRHQVYQEDFEIAERPVSNGEFLEFIQDGGYQDASLWLSDGWALVCKENWKHPLYWRPSDGGMREFSLLGLCELNLSAPASHISFYEASAYAAWVKARIPSEAEWELFASPHYPLKNGSPARVHPVPMTPDSTNPISLGSVWEWTSSAYTAYPGFQATEGALGEYNGKFMSGQMVLRGASCLTADGHSRASYRNFFPAPTRWQCAGFRLARDSNK